MNSTAPKLEKNDRRPDDLNLYASRISMCGRRWMRLSRRCSSN